MYNQTDLHSDLDPDPVSFFAIRTPDLFYAGLKFFLENDDLLKKNEFLACLPNTFYDPQGTATIQCTRL